MKTLNPDKVIDLHSWNPRKDFGLSSRAYNALKCITWKSRSVRWFANKIFADNFRLKNVGKITLAELDLWLKKYGLHRPKRIRFCPYDNKPCSAGKKK